MASTEQAFAALNEQHSTRSLLRRRTKTALLSESRATPRPCQTRLEASLTDAPLELPELVREISNESFKSSETVLYLGYGSNLSAETFRGKRNIKPISQLNVVVPAIQLTFDLPGVPYSEPCFGNCAYRKLPSEGEKTTAPDYHKDHWQKGLVGVVYEVTKADFVHIIATEGGGSGYQDVLVDCFALDQNPKQKVPTTPTTPAFKAHTLFAPIDIENRQHAYAQPSARYLKLITDGAAEHNLPYEYQDFLHQIRTFHITSNKQRLGQFIFMMLWAPLFLFIFKGAARIFIRPDGTFPKWFARLVRSIFTACWASYDDFFKPTFGDGERTIGDSDDSNSDQSISEKAPLIQDSIAQYGVHGRLETV